MYKTKLLELCQKRKWDLPVYETKKEGLDHNPLFLAKVTVTSTVFHSSTSFKSVKAAQNDVARLAYLHFTDQPRQSSASAEDTNQTPNQIDVNMVEVQDDKTRGVQHLYKNQLQMYAQKNKLALPVYSTESSASAEDTNQTPNQIDVNMVEVQDDKTRGVQHLYKNQLQMYAQKNKLALPVYSCDQMGPSHARRFKCTVTIGGQTFDSKEYFSKVNEAEHAAAKAALLKLSPQLTEELELGYKNLLQEFTQKEGYTLPSFKTVRSGEGHAPTFISTVEVNRKEFTGQPGKTKKQAEMSAAKVAFMALNRQCSTNPSSPPVVPVFQGQRPPPSSSSSLRSDLTAYLQRTLQPQMLVPNKEVKDADLLVPKEVKDGGIVEVNDQVVKVEPSESPRPEEDILAVTTTSAKLPSTLASPEHSVTLPNLPSGMYAGSTIIVHPRAAKMTYPPGSTELPISDDQWVAVQVKPEPQKR